MELPSRVPLRDTSELDESTDILVIDDHPVDPRSMQALLSPLGHRVVIAASAQEALALIEKQEFALILSDIEMPDMDGFELIAHVRERRSAPRTPLVFLRSQGKGHGDNDLNQARRAYALGAVDYLVKPVDPEVMRSKVAAWVKLFLQSKELRRRREIISEWEKEAFLAYAAAERSINDLLKAERANRTKDAYIGILGHDLRNPLTAISMSIHRLLNSKTLSESDRNLVTIMAGSSRRMRDMIRDIMDFTRCALGQTFPISRTPVDLGAICKDAIGELQLIHPDRTIHLETSGDLTGSWDPDRVEQVVSNLVGNGIEHSQAAVTVRAHGRPDRVFILVHNSGPPIPDELAPSVFEPFRRGSQTSKGLGLGLYIVKEIVRAHGGAVSVVSTAESGTTFVTEWPRTAASGT